MAGILPERSQAYPLLEISEVIKNKLVEFNSWN